MAFEEFDRVQEFQSTGPLRDPTLHIFLATYNVTNFNPQVPCGTRPEDFAALIAFAISIHRSLAGPDIGRLSDEVVEEIFQSTGPLRDPTQAGDGNGLSDRFQSTGPLRDPTDYGDVKLLTLGFQSTGPLRDPTRPP